MDETIFLNKFFFLSYSRIRAKIQSVYGYHLEIDLGTIAFPPRNTVYIVAVVYLDYWILSSSWTA
jgi:hypothetical protein